MASDLTGAGNCVDCGQTVSLCDHAMKRLTDPMLAFQGKVLGELQAELAERTGELAAERERNAPLRARIKAIQDQADQAGAPLLKRIGELERIVAAWRHTHAEVYGNLLAVAKERDEWRGRAAALEVENSQLRAMLEDVSADTLQERDVIGGAFCGICNRVLATDGHNPLCSVKKALDLLASEPGQHGVALLEAVTAAHDAWWAWKTASLYDAGFDGDLWKNINLTQMALQEVLRRRMAGEDGR